MKDDIRPRGTVEVRCNHPGCRWAFWVGPLDPRLPDGPFDCGRDHEEDVAVDAAFDALTGIGWHWCCYNKVDSGGVVLLRTGDKEAYGPNDVFTVLQWEAREELRALVGRVAVSPRMSQDEAEAIYSRAVPPGDPTPKALS